MLQESAQLILEKIDIDAFVDSLKEAPKVKNNRDITSKLVEILYLVSKVGTKTSYGTALLQRTHSLLKWLIVEHEDFNVQQAAFIALSNMLVMIETPLRDLPESVETELISSMLKATKTSVSLVHNIKVPVHNTYLFNIYLKARVIRKLTSTLFLYPSDEDATRQIVNLMHKFALRDTESKEMLKSNEQLIGFLDHMKNAISDSTVEAATTLKNLLLTK